jgi:hypothetical protein
MIRALNKLSLTLVWLLMLIPLLFAFIALIPILTFLTLIIEKNFFTLYFKGIINSVINIWKEPIDISFDTEHRFHA